MINGIVLDIDGVLVGDKPEFNFPHPHPEVIEKLIKIHKKGIPIVLCTGKGSFAIEKIAKDANLDNPHIADGGAIVIDSVSSRVIKTFSLEKDITSQIISLCVENDIYIEVYGVKEYYVQKGQAGIVTQKHASALQKDPELVDSLKNIENKDVIINLIAIAKNIEDKKRVEEILETLLKEVTFVWTIHPSILPYQFCLITAKGVSKKSAVQEIFDHVLKISLSEVLGVGDTLGDWNFMQLCEYVGVMGNAPDKLKELAREKNDNKFYIGPDVNQNGILDIFEYFDSEIKK